MLLLLKGNLLAGEMLVIFFKKLLQMFAGLQQQKKGSTSYSQVIHANFLLLGNLIGYN